MFYWTIRVKDLHLGPLYLGSVVWLENGGIHSRRWWRPTPLKALAKGHREARR